MTPDQINAAIAELCGEQRMFAVEKGGMYYREGGHGYTCSLLEAGRYMESAAKRELCAGEPMSIVPFPGKNYYGDLNACAEMEATLTDEQYIKYAQELNATWFKANPTLKNRIGICRSASATAPQRCEAFLRLHGRWVEA